MTSVETRSRVVEYIISLESTSSNVISFDTHLTIDNDSKTAIDNLRNVVKAIPDHSYQVANKLEINENSDHYNMY